MFTLHIIYYIFNCSTMCLLFIFFFNDTATTEIYTLSLHDALPISSYGGPTHAFLADLLLGLIRRHRAGRSEEQRLNSSHLGISYAVFCLKKKKNTYKLDKYFYIFNLIKNI